MTPLPSLLAFFVLVASASAAIGREALVHRHDIRVAKIDPEASLTMGNGDFAFTVDVTGLRSFEEIYYKGGIPLETLSTWAWHSHPNVDNLKLTDAMAPSDFHGRPVPYASLQESPAGKYFRENPHPLALGQIGFVYQGRPLAPDAITAIDQKLDLWTGVVRSTYMLAGQPVTVETAVHSGQSVVGARIESPLLANGDLQVRFRFSYAHDVAVKNKPPLVWDKPEKHRTTLARRGDRAVQLARIVDDSAYFANVQWEGAGEFTEAGTHDTASRPRARTSSQSPVRSHPTARPAADPTSQPPARRAHRAGRTTGRKAASSTSPPPPTRARRSSSAASCSPNTSCA
jgi:hypothetical protein